MGTLGWITFLLVVIGGLSWGLIGFFGLDVIKVLFGDMTTITRVIYGLVGLAALYELFTRWGRK
jgi:hypothetical protein